MKVSVNYLRSLVIGILLVLLIGSIDLITGYQISFSIFYLIPIMWITWQSGKKSGFFISLLSAIAWLEADLLAEHLYTHPAIPYWNAFMRFGIFVLITYILSILKKSLENEKKLARLDHLTQAANYRSFSEAIFLEIQRAQRYKHPFSLAYLDLDNFKLVNDRFGHEAGNKLLQETVALMQTETRKTDLVGRLGGDEFAILMPETDKRSARDVLVRIKNKFALEMENKNYQVSMSIGCITYLDVPLEVDDILQKADELMYSIKKRGKDNLSCEDYVFPAKKNAS